VIIGAAFSDEFHAGGYLAIALAWAVLFGTAVLFLLGRLVATDRRE